MSTHTSSDAGEVSFTLRKPPYTYLHLRVSRDKATTSSDLSSVPSLDEVTVRQHLVHAMTQYLGLTGSAIPIDVLKVDDQDAWVRVATEDEDAVVTSLSQWTGKGIVLTVQGRASWLGALVARDQPKKLWTIAA